MKHITEFGRRSLQSKPVERPFWIVLIVTSGIGLSPFFACATPFAALATLAALKLSRTDAITAVGLVWLTNQAIGYGILGYPWEWSSLAWGLAIGASAGLAIMAASALSTARPAPVATSLPFMAAFVTFESGLYIAGFVLPGSSGAFTAAVVWQVFEVNALAICGLLAVYQVAVVGGLVSRNPVTINSRDARLVNARP